MLAAVPFKYSGNALEILCLAGGEAFLLAGIFTRERLFRSAGLLGYFRSHPLPEERIAQINEIIPGRKWPQPAERNLKVRPDEVQAVDPR